MLKPGGLVEENGQFDNIIRAVRVFTDRFSRLDFSSKKV